MHIAQNTVNFHFAETEFRTQQKFSQIAVADRCVRRTGFHCLQAFQLRIQKQQLCAVCGKIRPVLPGFIAVGERKRLNFFRLIPLFADDDMGRLRIALRQHKPALADILQRFSAVAQNINTAVQQL